MFIYFYACKEVEAHQTKRYLPANAILYFRPSNVVIELVGDAISQTDSSLRLERVVELPPKTFIVFAGNLCLAHCLKSATGG